jgi:hypothetical protein
VNRGNALLAFGSAERSDGTQQRDDNSKVSARFTSVDQPYEQDNYEDNDQNTEYQLDILVVSSPRSPWAHLS